MAHKKKQKMSRWRKAKTHTRERKRPQPKVPKVVAPPVKVAPPKETLAVRPNLTAVVTEQPQAPSAAVQLVRGMRDILPKDQNFWRWLSNQAEQTSDAFSFGRIDLPIIEYTKLYERPLGPTSDVVSKEMFSFQDRSGLKVSLRPEGTAGAVRAYLEHGMQSHPQPIRLMYYGAMFRYERPQAGRYRQHHQLGFEIFGDAQPVSDALIMVTAHHFLTSLGLKVQFQVNSLGCSTDRDAFTARLVEFLKPSKRELCEDCQARLQKNPLRVLDCKVAACRVIVAKAPQMIDHLCEPCRDHLMGVLEYLDEAGVFYALNPSIVRGFDYYTRTIFEIWPMVQASSPSEIQSSSVEIASLSPMPDSIGGGGRYDNLVEMLGGRPTPACGVGLGLERVIKALRESDIRPPTSSVPDVFLAQLGDTARRSCFGLLLEFQERGLRVVEAFTKSALREQLGMASERGALFTVIIGHKEVVDGTAIVRDMGSGVQEVVDRKKIVDVVMKRLEKLRSQGEATLDVATPKQV